jgi:uncharacterized protein involved in exopolysaccharide biosynthesis
MLTETHRTILLQSIRQLEEHANTLVCQLESLPADDPKVDPLLREVANTARVLVALYGAQREASRVESAA